MKSALMALAMVLGATAASAQVETPEQFVRRFYDHVGLELDPAMRPRFAPPLRKILDDNARIVDSGEGQCLDPNIALDAPDYDAEEVARSLKLVGSTDGDKAKVLVAFLVKGKPRRMEWKLQLSDGQWTVADIVSITSEWALSQYNCE